MFWSEVQLNGSPSGVTRYFVSLISLNRTSRNWFAYWRFLFSVSYFSKSARARSGRKNKAIFIFAQPHPLAFWLVPISSGSYFACDLDKLKTNYQKDLSPVESLSRNMILRHATIFTTKTMARRVFRCCSISRATCVETSSKKKLPST